MNSNMNILTIAEPRRTMMMVSDDEDDNFSITPNSKRSRAGGKRRAADASTHQELSHITTTSTPESRKPAKFYHPYHNQRSVISGERYHDRAEHILRRHSHNQYLDGMSIEVRCILSMYSPHIYIIIVTSVGSRCINETHTVYEHALLPLRRSLQRSGP